MDTFKLKNSVKIRIVSLLPNGGRKYVRTADGGYPYGCPLVAVRIRGCTHTVAPVYPGLCVRVSARPRVRVYADTVNELRECQHEGSLPLGRVASQRDAAAGQAHDLS